MDYEQTLKNIEFLKNFIMPFDCELIYFDFSSASAFNVMFYDYINWDEMTNIRLSKMQKDLPYARISKTKGAEIFLYMDEFVDFEFNLVTSEIITYKYWDKIKMEKVRQELTELCWHLKKSS